MTPHLQEKGVWLLDVWSPHVHWSLLHRFLQRGKTCTGKWVVVSYFKLNSLVKGEDLELAKGGGGSAQLS